MKRDTTPRPAQEIELKLALPAADPASLATLLARTPVLARRKPTQLRLHNIYFDTPEQALRQARAALRLRRVGSEARPRWLQTFKTGARSDSALSQRGEWEVPVPGARLKRDALPQAPWSEIDPQGNVFRALKPCFETTFQRTSWTVRRRDHSLVEVSLDIGQISAGGQHSAICELELELLEGPPQALFDIAGLIAQRIAILPASMSKAQRGYALAQNQLDRPLRAQPPALPAKLSLTEAAQRVLRETFSQFTTNLNALRSSDDPELVHQARVGWRRFRSAWRLFRPVLAAEAAPSCLPLQPLTTFLGELRDLDVARIETLPLLAAAYNAGDAARAKESQALADALLQAATLQRKAVRYALQSRTVGQALLATTRWIERLSELSEPRAADAEKPLPLRAWARQRVVHLHTQLKHALKQESSPEQQHRVRILSKRLRYGIEALRPLLPKKRAARWYEQALQLQTTLGMTRDLMQASALATQLEANRALAEFLRGVAVGQDRSAGAATGASSDKIGSP
ncbi:MAG: CHAD domain-containing protein [Hylemonella sp.]|nr:CHAD domain-containing protein [Hylemonella sp.]